MKSPVANERSAATGGRRMAVWSRGREAGQEQHRDVGLPDVNALYVDLVLWG